MAIDDPTDHGQFSIRFMFRPIGFTDEFSTSGADAALQPIFPYQLLRQFSVEITHG